MTKKKGKVFEVLRGMEKGDKRYESGDYVSTTQLRGWPVAALVDNGTLKEVEDGNRKD